MVGAFELSCEGKNMAARTSKTGIQCSLLLLLTLAAAMPAEAQYAMNNYSYSATSVKTTGTYSPQMSTQYTSQISPQPISTASTATLSPVSAAPITSMPTLAPITSVQPTFSSTIMSIPVTPISVISSPLANVNVATLAPLTPTFQTTFQTSVLTSPTFTLSSTQTLSTSVIGNLQPLTQSFSQPKYNFNLLHVLGGIKGTVGNAGGTLGTVVGEVGGAVSEVAGAVGGAVSGAVSGGSGCGSLIPGGILACVASGRQTGVLSQQFAASDSLVNVVSIVNAGVISTAQSNMQLSLFSSANQVLQGAKGQRIGGGVGAMISHNEELVILHRGCIIVASGELPSNIQTRAGDLALKANSLVQIDDTGKHIRVSAVSGDKDSVCLRGGITNGQEVLANPGQELIISADGIEEEELICADGSVETLVLGSIEKRPNVARKTYVAEQNTITDGPARAGRHVRLGNAMPGSFKSGVNSFDPRQAELWNRLKLSTRDDESSPLQISALPGCQLEPSADGALNLIRGTVFVAPKNRAKLQTKFADLEIKRNGLVMVEHVDGISRIKALSGPDDVLVSCAGERMPLAPGQELLIADRAPSDVQINPADAIARRARSSNLSAGELNLILNDFSISSMLRYVGYRKMITSVDAKLFERVLKIAAVVELVGRGRGQYSYSALYQQQNQQAASIAQQVDKISSANDKQIAR